MYSFIEGDNMGKSLAYWNKYIQNQIPDLELVKGNGYMYFSWSEKAGSNTLLKSLPESIYVPYINQISKDMIDSAIEEVFETNPKILESKIDNISRAFMADLLFGE